MTARRRGIWLLVATGALATLLVAPTLATAGPTGAAEEVVADWHTLRTPPLAPGQIELVTLSTLPDAVTGGDVLVAVRGLAPDDDLMVTRDGVDVAPAFARQGSTATGLVTGLRSGANTLEATAHGQLARLVVHDHPVTGPVLSGPHQTPFRCATAQAGLGEPLDDDCSAPPKVQWFARTGDQAFHELSDPYAPYPSDTITTETADGVAVPFVVRVESRTINRGIARLAVLDDPAARGRAAPFAAEGWSGRVYHAFGESCGVGYQQGRNSADTVLGNVDLTDISGDNLLINLTGITDRLGKGDLTVHSTLTAFGVHCNPLVSVETLMMIKEHIAEQYGRVPEIVGTNGSGAALQQYNAINNAPGLLAGAMPSATFADIVTTAMTVSDCGLLHHYFDTSSLEWTDAQRAAVDGHGLLGGTQLNSICQSWIDQFLSRIDPTAGCAVPAELRYDPEDNPTGARCTIQDANVNIFGRDPATGFARRPLDNVGVQYGLNALRGGLITVDQFLDINQRIGGLDIDGKVAPQRMAADPQARRAAYLTGRMLDGGGGLRDIPIIDHRGYADARPAGDIHQRYHSFSTRERLIEANGDADNQVLLTESTRYGLFVLTSPIVVEAMLQMDRWILAAQADRSSRRTHDVVVTSKPADLVDACFTVTDEKIVERQVYEGATRCNELYPAYASPRLVAGGPLTNDVITCQRRAPVRSDYPQMSHAQWALLRTVFATGVCDYRRPGVDETGIGGTWAFFTSPGTWSFHESRR